MSTVPAKLPSQSAVLEDIDWPTYSRLLRIFEKRRRRLTYDRGRLEIMSPLWEHESPADLLGHFVRLLTVVHGLPIRLGGSVTLRRRRYQRGVEPDRCYWIANAPRVRGRTHLDLRVDPPPDLVVEIDITSSSLPRMPIYARLGLPEVWRVDRERLTFHVLESEQYQVRANSLSFPALRSVDLEPFLALAGQPDDNVVLGQFEAWARQHLLGGTNPSISPTP
jgi:Uma2 family endonuclease